MKTDTFKNSQDFRKRLEVRLQRTAKEKGIDLQRIKSQDDSLAALILNDLQQLAAVDLGDNTTFDNISLTMIGRYCLKPESN